ncbi:MAG: Acetyltransferase domain [Candidatus Parcubacteria bacterium]|jgi:predicted N-acetyltransferase YhbS
MSEIQISDLGIVTDSKFGLKTKGEREAPLPVTVEDINPDEAKEILIQFGYKEDTTGQASVHEAVERMRNGEQRYFTAKDPQTGKIVGLSSVSQHKDNTVYLEVLPDFQGRRIGPQLIDGLKQRYSRLSLENTIGSNGHAFYENLGFRDEGMRGHMVWEKPEVK